MAPVLKTGVPERVPGVRIPPSPPVLLDAYDTVVILQPGRVAAGQNAGRRRGVKFERPTVAVDAGQVVKMRSSGMSWRAIAAETGIAKDTLRGSLQPSA